MGHMTHHAIIVTDNGGDSEDRIITPWKRARRVFGPHMVSSIVEAKVNGHRSFFIGPDGSKTGWNEDEAGNRARDAFKDYLRGAEVDWVEVQYADDDHDNRVTAGTGFRAGHDTGGGEG